MSIMYVSDGRAAIGHIIPRGPRGYEAFNRSDASLGTFKTQSEAANACFKAAESEQGAG